jgi:hypothetical protein
VKARRNKDAGGCYKQLSIQACRGRHRCASQDVFGASHCTEENVSARRNARTKITGPPPVPILLCKPGRPAPLEPRRRNAADDERQGALGGVAPRVLPSGFGHWLLDRHRIGRRKGVLQRLVKSLFEARTFERVTLGVAVTGSVFRFLDHIGFRGARDLRVSAWSQGRRRHRSVRVRAARDGPDRHRSSWRD